MGAWGAHVTLVGKTQGAEQEECEQQCKLGAGSPCAVSVLHSRQGDGDRARGQKYTRCRLQQKTTKPDPGLRPLPPPVEKVICLCSLLKVAKTLRSKALFFFCFIFISRMNKKEKIQHEATSKGQHNKTT